MNSESIINYLEIVSNNNVYLNLIMHLIAFTALLSVLLISNEKKRSMVVNSAILVLFLSVTINAFIYGNPFHLITFSILAAFTILELYKGKSIYNASGNQMNTLISVLLIAIGLWYPEFVNMGKLQLLLFSPVGIVPCPTLLTALGLMGLSYPKVNKLLYSTTIIMGLVYGIIGTFIFKVYLDLSLLVAAIYGMTNLYRLMGNRKESIGITRDNLKLNNIK